MPNLIITAFERRVFLRIVSEEQARYLKHQQDSLNHYRLQMEGTMRKGTKNGLSELRMTFSLLPARK